jgi:Uma2 family endonuclease
MSIAPPSMTLNDYLNYSDLTDTRYELVNGELIAMPPESTLNNQIASFLFAHFLQMGIPYYRLSIGSQIAVSGAKATARQPDLVVFSEAVLSELEGATQCVITHDMSPPSLVVEIVSPQQETRDYRYKRTEYAGRCIPEYWIVDPLAKKVTVLHWVEGLYEEKIYTGEQSIMSSQVVPLNITATMVLSAGRC